MLTKIEGLAIGSRKYSTD